MGSVKITENKKGGLRAAIPGKRKREEEEEEEEDEEVAVKAGKKGKAAPATKKKQKKNKPKVEDKNSALALLDQVIWDTGLGHRG